MKPAPNTTNASQSERGRIGNAGTPRAYGAENREKDQTMSTTTEKTPGQRAYESDVARDPLYQDKTARRSWESMPDWMQWSWERDPTPRT